MIKQSVNYTIFFAPLIIGFTYVEKGPSTRL